MVHGQRSSSSPTIWGYLPHMFPVHQERKEVFFAASFTTFQLNHLSAVTGLYTSIDGQHYCRWPSHGLRESPAIACRIGNSTVLRQFAYQPPASFSFVENTYVCLRRWPLRSSPGHGRALWSPMAPPAALIWSR
jgi:hypothetical protein